MPAKLAALFKAHDTLKSGTDHVISRAQSHRAEGKADAIVQTRMLGNSLRELDRFLSICTDEATRHLDSAALCDPAFARLRNTPRKLCLVEARIGARTSRHVRLRAIGRVRACLHHCSGRIHDAAIHGDVALAHGSGCGTTPPSGPEQGESQRLILAGATVVSISNFYREIADDLLAGVLREPQSLTFRA